MAYVSYLPTHKILAVRWHLAGRSLRKIRRRLGKDVSKHSIQRWTQLFRKFRSIIRNPATFRGTRGCPKVYKAQEQSMIKALVKSYPGLFLSEIREKVYNTHGTMPSISTVQTEFRLRLGFTLKIAQVSSIRKNHLAKLTWMDRMMNYPAEFLVFTGGLCGEQSVV